MRKRYTREQLINILRGLRDVRAESAESHALWIAAVDAIKIEDLLNKPVKWTQHPTMPEHYTAFGDLHGLMLIVQPTMKGHAWAVKKPGEEVDKSGISTTFEKAKWDSEDAARAWLDE